MILHLLSWTPEGVTSFEAEEFFDWPHQTVSSALSIAEEQGLICRSGEKRLGPSGKKSYVYYDIRYVPVEQRLPVIRRGVQVFEWALTEDDDYQPFIGASDSN